jgi:hypothetical protein
MNKKEIRAFEEQILIEENKEAIKQSGIIYDKISPSVIKSSEKLSQFRGLKVNMKKPFNSKLLLSLLKCKRLNLITFTVYLEPQIDKPLTFRLEELSKLSWEKFGLIWTRGYATPITNLVRPLSSIQNNGLKEVTISRFMVKDKQLWRIISLFRKVTYIALLQCIIKTENQVDLKEALEGSSIKWISLMGCGLDNFSDWVANPHRFENIVSSLRTSPALKHQKWKLMINKEIALDVGISTDKLRIKYGIAFVELF